MRKATQKYLDNYAAPAAAALDWPGRYWQAVVVVPLRAEAELFPIFTKQLSALPAGDRHLFCCVINAREQDTERVFASNERVRTHILSLGQLSWESTSPCGVEASLVTGQTQDFLIIDRSRRPMPSKHGVGHARKLGCDIMLAWQAKHRCFSSELLFNTDADVLLPPDYFSETAQQHTAAVIKNFTHMTNAEGTTTEQALALYDRYLRYYVAGLAHAGSPYAFPCIGSTVAVPFAQYAVVRGWPQRQAGEDFYLLNKLAKVGAIDTSQGQPIQIHCRLSERVPFGTGKATATIQQLLETQQEYDVYHPAIFSVLKRWLRGMRSDCDATLRQDETFQSMLNAYGWQDDFARLQADTKKPPGSVDTWFDGFKTLKAVHYLRDNGYPSAPLTETSFDFR